MGEDFHRLEIKMAIHFCLMLIFAVNVLHLVDAGQNCSWTYFADKQIIGGQQVNADDIDKCKAACEESKDCEGIDFDLENDYCFLLQTKTGKVSKKGIAHYDYNCPTCFWTYYADKQIPGGKQIPVDNVTGCQEACANTRHCQGIDFDPKAKKCFLIDTRERPVPYTGIEHYDYNCFVCSWTFYAEHHISGGEQVSAETPSDCKSACEDAEYCQGVDFDDKSKRCFLLKTKFGKTPYTGVGHYDLDCQTCSWTYFADQHISGGQQTSAENLPDCQNECLETGGCQGIDFDTTNRCFLLETKDPKESSAKVKHYDYNCHACSWTYYPDRQISGGQQVSAKNLSDCFAACMKQGGCRSIDFDSKSNSCFLIKTKDGKLSAPDIQHYDFDCQTRPKRDSCSWRYFPDHNVDGGQKVEVSNIRDCQAACVQRGDCQSIDFNTDTDSCFLLKYKDEKVSSPGVNHYDYNCQSCFWTYFPDQKISGGQPVRAADIGDCQEACEQRGDCQGIDFDTNSKSCFLLMTKDNKKPAIGIEHYDYKCYACSWKYFADQQISGGQQVTAAGTLKDCQTSCKQTGSCRSFDFYNEGHTCFLLKTTDNKTPSKGVDHYDFDCNACEWTYCADNRVLGGKQGSAATLADCQAECLRAGDCQSIDFERITMKCFLIKTKGIKVPFLGIDHYDYNCRACDWKRYTGQQIIGGKQKIVSDLRDCLFACVRTGDCQSVDYDTNANTCFLINTRDGRKSAPGIDHYELDCPDKSDTRINVGGIVVKADVPGTGIVVKLGA